MFLLLYTLYHTCISLVNFLILNNNVFIENMDAIMLKRKEIFFNNLVLLGLDVIKFEKNHGITFNK